MPQISIIVPVYNVEPYLRRCVDSILAQTFTDFELILVDDGSPDNCGVICDEYARIDSRVKVIHQENRGVSAARNAGLNVCTGNIITFVDSDDWLDLETLENVHICMIENQADAVICGLEYYCDGKPSEHWTYSFSICDYSGTIYRMMREYSPGIGGKFVSRELIYRTGRFHPFALNLALGEDTVWLLEVLQNCRRVVFLPQLLYCVLVREGSLSRQKELTENRLSIVEAVPQMLQAIPDDASLRVLLQMNYYSYIYPLKVQSYISGDYLSMKKIDQLLSLLRRDWIQSKDISVFTKIKNTILEIEMYLHFPKIVVEKTNLIKRPNKLHRKQIS